jgi:predicted kinase
LLILLVGPKGSGKSHIGRALERNLGVRFFHVEPLWMSHHAECQAFGRAPVIAEGIAKVHPRVREALRTYEHVCVESTGASPEILQDLLSLAPPSKRLIARVSAPLDLCLERIAARDPTHQIPLDVESIRKIYALSTAAQVQADLAIENVQLSEPEILTLFKITMDAQSKT